MTSQGYVVAAREVAARRDSADTAAIRETIGPATGCVFLEQLVIDFAPGRSASRTIGEAEEVLYVLSGAGAVLTGEDEHLVEAGTGVYLAPGRSWAVDNPGPDDLSVVAVRLPDPPTGDGPHSVALRLADQPASSATADREFRLVADPSAGCRSATQFVGYIPPGRAPEHYHRYDEVIYVLRGTGVLHLQGGDTPIGPGSCIHLPPRLRHSLENAGPTPMEVLGVFRPAGSPSEAYYPDGTPAMSDTKSGAYLRHPQAGGGDPR